MSTYIIHEWDASYYCWQDKTWKYGILAVCPNCICFFEGNGKTMPIISLSLSHVSGFQRRLVSYIFKAVLISVEGAKPQWFSSLKNREESYYFMQHFWQQKRLLGTSYSRQTYYQNRPGTSTSSTVDHQERRQKVFKLLYDSENTLAEAANSLQDQGEQFDRASRTMNALHQDLNVAETLINGLNRWLTKWDIKPDNFYEINLKKEFPILYRNHPTVYFSPGILLLTQDQLNILNDRKVVVATVLLKELTTILVTTPWNITLVKTVIGHSDIIIDISSANVVYIIKSLQPCFGDKFEYEESPSHLNKVVDFGDHNESCHILPAASLEPDNTQGTKLINTENLERLQEEQEHEILSEIDKADAEKISEVVGNMKSLAVSIGQEMTRQLDSLDQLSESVDRANYRIQKDNKQLRDKL